MISQLQIIYFLWPFTFTTTYSTNDHSHSQLITSLMTSYNASAFQAPSAFQALHLPRSKTLLSLLYITIILSQYLSYSSNLIVENFGLYYFCNYSHFHEYSCGKFWFILFLQLQPFPRLFMDKAVCFLIENIFHVI